MTESLSQHPGLMEDIGPHIIHPTPSLLPEGELREGRIYLLKPSGERYGSKIGNVLTEENIKKLPDYRLIIVPLPDKLKPSGLKENYEKGGSKRDGRPIDAQDIPYDPPKPTCVPNLPINQASSPPAGIPFYKLPPSYTKILKAICPHCYLSANILWRNVQQVQSRYESRFRPWKAINEEKACFLQFHTMQAPVLADWELRLALVHHLSVSNNSQDPDVLRPFDEKNHHEQIFAFIYVKHKDWKTDQIKDMTTDVIEQHLLPSIQLFQEEHPEYNRLDDHGNEVSPYQGIAPSGGSIWLTPMLFMGVLLKWYGFKAAHVVVQSFEDLVEIDKELMQADKGIWYGNIKKQAEKCNSLNLKLTKLNTSLIGLRSRVNYVADTTRDMVTDICTMTKFVTDELNGGDYDKICPRKFLKQALKLLDSSKFVKRDNDKFDLTARTMQQYSVDIKSLKAHMTINIGLVSNHYSQLLAEAAARDSSMVLVLTVIGVILLPFTFAAVLLTAPVFDFTVSDPNWITISRKLGWKVWGTISGVAYFVFLLIFLGLLFVQELRRKKQEKEAESKREQAKSSSADEVPPRTPDGEVNHDGRHGTNGGLPRRHKNFTKGGVFAKFTRSTVQVGPAVENETV